MGLEAYTCYNPNDLVDMIHKALHKIEKTNKPILIEAIVDENEIPPTMGRQ